MSWSLGTVGGPQADTPRVDATPESDARARAIAMARMRLNGRSLRNIARFFGTNHMYVKRSIDRIPSGVIVGR